MPKIGNRKKKPVSAFGTGKFAWQRKPSIASGLPEQNIYSQKSTQRRVKYKKSQYNMI